MSRNTKILIFIAILVLANLYLLRDGFWFYQDAGFWPKTDQEAIMIFLQQFHSFTNLGYSMGFDQGLFNFTRILIVGFTSFVFGLFKQNSSQIIFTFSGYILSFASFYLFSGIFFKEKKFRYILSLVYAFNPFSYTLQGYVFFNATVPLFIYSFYKYFFSSEEFRIKYLLLNIFASYIWVSYIRFIQGFSFIIIPYILYLTFHNRKKLNLKKIVIYIFSYVLVLAPIIFSFLSQLLEKSNTAFYYGSILGNFVTKYKAYDLFNLFQSGGTKLYQNEWWAILGLTVFAYIVYLIVTFSRKKHSGFYLMNLLLVLLGITMYGLGNIFGNTIYPKVIHFLPFIINEPYWAMYIIGVPFIILLGLLTNDRIKSLYIFAVSFIFLAILPLLNLSDFQLQKFNLSKIPPSYYVYFIKPNYGIAEPTHYIPGVCWRAEFMDRENIPTFCPNYGLRYVPILLDNPRLASGDTFELSNKLRYATDIGNLRVIYNLKNIIVANDIVKTKGPGPLTGDRELQKVIDAKKAFDSNILFDVIKNKNFNLYYFKNKNQYDFTLYSPKSVVYKNIGDIVDSPLDMNEIPVVLKKENMINTSPNLQSAKVFYKMSPSNPTRYDVEISAVDQSKPFVIQLNQAYGEAWKLKFVDENTYNKYPCMGELKEFTITNNQRCQYNNGFFNWDSLKLLNAPEIKSDNHFAGNFLGNGWLINGRDIPVQFRENRNLYAVIIFTKQIYYIYTILIAGIALITLLIVCVIQEIIIKIRRNN